MEKRLVTRYAMRSAEAADENQLRVEGVFDELAATTPDNVSYIVLRLADDSFLHVSFHNHGDDVPNPIASSAASRTSRRTTPTAARAASTSRRRRWSVRTSPPSTEPLQPGRYRSRSAVAVCAGTTSASRSSSMVLDANVASSASRSRYRAHMSTKSKLPAGWTTT